MNRFLVMSFLILLLFVTSTAIVAADTLSPTQQLQPTLDKLITLLADESLKGDEKKDARREKIMETISVSFDFRKMSKLILGETWNSINRYERDYFTKLMTKLLENNYIGNLENYSGETIEYVKERIKGGKARVYTVISSKGRKHPVTYSMFGNGGKWMVYDINIEGVTLVRNYKADFLPTLRKEKFEGLIKVLEDKNKSFE